MNAVSLINQLASRDIRLWLEQDQLRYSAPDGAMTPDIIAELRQHKADIVHFLQQSGQQQQLIPPVDHQQPLPVSFAQQRLWFLHQLDPASSAYHIVATLRIDGALDVARLQQACRQIIERHAVLRSVYRQLNGQLQQIITDGGNWQMQQQRCPAEQLDAAIRQLQQQPFDLACELPLRCTLFRLDEHHYRLAFVIHHIAADGWSLGLLVDELTRLYQGQNLPPLAIQYADYAAWQAGEAQQARLAGQLDYWREQLAGAPDLALPLDHARNPLAPASAGVLLRKLDETASSALQAFNRRHDSTLFITMMALYSALLYRYSQQNDFCIGTPVAGRHAGQLEPLIGCFLNLLAIRCEPQPGQSFRDHLATTRQRCRAALANQDAPFEQVVQALGGTRDINITPLFQTLLSVQNTPPPTAQPAGLVIGFVDSDEADAQFDLKLTVQENNNGVQLAFEYKKALFDDRTIERLADAFVRLCRHAIEQPDTALSALPLFAKADLAEVLGLAAGGINDTAAALPDDCLIHHLFADQVQRSPDAIAISDSERTLTYRELDAESSRLAQLLALRNRPGQLVGLCMQRSVSMSIALLGILKAGCAYVPFDPDFPPERLAFMVQDTGIGTLLCDRASMAIASDISGCFMVLEDTDLSAFAASAPAIDLAADALFNVIYTSGSTGQPKGVMVPHRGIANRLLWMQKNYPLDAGDCVLQKTPYSFDVSVWELFWPLLCGSHLHFAGVDDHRDPLRLRQLIIERQVTTMHFVPSMLGAFLATDDIEQCRPLRQVFCSGEALQRSQAERFLQRLPDCRLHNLYGPTEASIDVSFHHCQAGETTPSVPIGRPIDNTQLHVLDPFMNPVPAGVAGELYIGGINLARGYLNREALTEQCFVANPFAALGHPSPRLYKSGDLVRQAANGELLYLGRLDHQVKLRGLRIELGEIENALARQPQIRECVVATRDNNGDSRLVAWYLADAELAPDTLAGELARHLPAYMVPAAFVRVAAWPLSPNGKINRNKLPEPDWASLNRRPWVAPSSDTEKQLAAIWQQVLGVDNIGANDNFFELGGHSLTAVQALGLARQQFGTELPLRQVFDQPTIAAIAALLDQARLEQQVFVTDETAGEDDDSFIL
ncbi:MAG TPA: amino acid adenylation domain-containing protein [Pseudomonadales bacterium]